MVYCLLEHLAMNDFVPLMFYGKIVVHEALWEYQYAVT